MKLITLFILLFVNSAFADYKSCSKYINESLFGGTNNHFFKVDKKLKIVSREANVNFEERSKKNGLLSKERTAVQTFNSKNPRAMLEIKREGNSDKKSENFEGKILEIDYRVHDSNPFNEGGGFKVSFNYDSKGNCFPEIKEKKGNEAIGLNGFDTKFCRDLYQIFKDHPELEACKSTTLLDKINNVLKAKEQDKDCNLCAMNSWKNGLSKPETYDTPVFRGASILSNCSSNGLDPFVTDDKYWAQSGKLEKIEEVTKE